VASIAINIPDGKLQRVIDGIAVARNYRATMSDGTPNPETKAQFARRMVAEQIKDWVAQAEGAAADIAARQAIVNDANIVS